MPKGLIFKYISKYLRDIFSKVQYLFLNNLNYNLIWLFIYLLLMASVCLFWTIQVRFFLTESKFIDFTHVKGVYMKYD